MREVLQYPLHLLELFLFFSSNAQVSLEALRSVGKVKVTQIA